MRVASLPHRVLMGPGPSDVDPRVLRALSQPTIGHLDPLFLELMDDLRRMLQQVFGTVNPTTLAVSGTGSAGMETCLVNVIEPGDRVLIGVNGVFGTRMCEVARRCGAEVTAVDAPWGQPLDYDALRVFAKQGPYKLVGIVHAETSTGVLHDLAPLREIADTASALLLIDCVTSLGGVPVNLDAHGVDLAYSGTQKCLSCPPGLSPVSFSPRAALAMKARKTNVQSWYLDVGLVSEYWGAERAYHHTAPINMLYGLHEALCLVLEEGLDARFARHRQHAAALAAGLEALGLELVVPAESRLPPLTLVTAPTGIDEARVRRELLSEYNLEIGGGLGPLKGKAWRIGLMGSGCSQSNVERCLGALHAVLDRHGWAARKNPLDAARTHWERRNA